ncbi:polysaccharide biosynthesis/export family protein [Pseudodesulfovibrio sediminis]|uniref:Polysaccharide export outer membrane protein n=1 Tax=Pseudodesulfovibrio sediminis TaxID=2810563 RepID=A0ABM8I392_9BACT|nr:polysaccharide biosynthesis/export family protein [Pseudodesulfovibrio sediminis]BCS89123.1 hypothetical protein PSDVSF_23650 [Pseudodesulfovibrio sediminis]
MNIKRALLTVGMIFVLCFSYVSMANAVSMDTFTLGAGDVLEISVWDDERLTRPTVVVRPDGKISFPLVGELQAAGKTVEELRKDFASRMEKYIPDASVTIMLQQLGSAQVYIVGKVNRPGVYLMSGRVTVLQALALAGGITPFAESDEILVVRVDNGKQTYLPFDYVKAVAGDGLDQNITLEPGDTLLIP